MSDKKLENEVSSETQGYTPNPDKCEVQLVVGDDTPVSDATLSLEIKEDMSDIEKEIIEKENKRLKHNSYHREYYKNNKEKYNKHCLPGRKRGERGGNRNLRYKLSILNEETKNEMLSENYKTLQDIANVLQLPRHTVSLIFRKKYQSGMGKQKKTKEYSRYKIEKL